MDLFNRLSLKIILCAIVLGLLINLPVYCATYASWKASVFSASEQGSSAISGELANPSGDGISNLLKYALGLDPHKIQTPFLPGVSIIKTSGTNYLAITYQTPAADPPTDLIYTPQLSTNLGNWSQGAGVVSLYSQTGSNATYIANTPASVLGGAFMRLQVAQRGTLDISLASGSLSAATSATISGVTGATYYYTQDGTIPTASSKLYTGPITISYGQTLMCQAYVAGVAYGSVVAADYTMNPNQHPVPYAVNLSVLNSFVGVHPRLFINSGTGSGSIPYLTAQINTGTSMYYTIWTSYVKPYADSIVDQVPYAASYTGDGTGTVMLWQRTVGNNMPTLAMAYLLTKPTPPASPIYTWIEAEETALTLPMAVTTDTSASAQGYISTSSTTATNNPNALTTPSAQYSFPAAVSGTYYFWARVQASDTSSDSFWFGLDGQPPGAYSNITIPAPYKQWNWSKIGVSKLTPGNHLINITYREAGAKIDKFLVTTATGYTPTGFGTEQHQIEAEDFVVNTGTMQAYSTDAIAYGQQYLGAISGAKSITSTPSSTSTPDASRVFTISSGVSGNYDIYVRLKGTNSSQYCYFALDSGTYSKLATTVNNDWVWLKSNTNTSLKSGTHVLKITNGQTGTMMDQVIVMPTGTTAPLDPSKYAVGTMAWALAACNYTNWGLTTSGTVTNQDGVDLPAGHELLGLGCVYDWLYSDLGTADLNTITSTLGTRAANMYAAASTRYSGAYWQTEWLQNHMWICEGGLTVAGLAIYGDAGTTGTAAVYNWLQDGMMRFGNTMNYLGTDGASQEGPAYWEYGVEWMLKYMHLSKALMGADMFNTPWFGNTAMYRLYFAQPFSSVVPGNSNNISHIDFADDARVNWYGPSHIFRKLATLSLTYPQYTNPEVAQWYAHQLETNGINAEGAADWLDLVWFSPSIAELSPVQASLPTSQYFPDMDMFVARSAWSGSESVVAFQCGPFMGHSVQTSNTTGFLNYNNYVDWGGGHSHPAANNFCIFGYGDWLLQNDGYLLYKVTGQANTLLTGTVPSGEGHTASPTPDSTIDVGRGQYGEVDSGSAANWFSPYTAGAQAENPSIDNTLTHSTPLLDYMVGDACTAYPATSKLTKFKRHLLYLKPDVLVVVDDITASSAQTFELRFYPEQQNATLMSGTAYPFTTYRTSGTHGTLNLSYLTPTPGGINTELFATQTHNSTTVNRLCYSIVTGSAVTSWSNAVAFAWAPNASGTNPGTPKQVTMVQDADGTAWKFKVAALGQTIVLDRNKVSGYLDEKARVVNCMEAESGTLTSPMKSVAGDATASGTSYIVETTLTNNPDTLTQPSAQYTFSVATSGTYATWARARGSSNGNAFWYAFNPTANSYYTNTLTTNTTGVWGWVKVATVTLNAGSNTIAIKYKLPNAQLDQIIVTDDVSYTPEATY